MREAAPAKPAGRWKSCDSDVDAWRPRTSCAFARNVFYEYWVAGQISPVMVHDPTLSRALPTRCRVGVARVLCSTADGRRVRIPIVALEMYSDDLAADYAASHDTGTGSTSALEDPEREGR